MTKDIDIIHMTQWANSGCLLKGFYEIFNIPYPAYEEISKAISHLSELFNEETKTILHSESDIEDKDKEDDQQ